MDCGDSRDKQLTDQRGSVLLGALLLVFVVTLVGIGLFQASTIETRNVQLTETDAHVFYAADTGISRAALDMADPGAPPAIGTLCFDTQDHNPSALCTTPVKWWLNTHAGQTLTVFPGTTCFGGASCDSANPHIPAYIVEATNHADTDRFWLTATACIPGPASNPCPSTARATAQVKTLIVQSSTGGNPILPDAILGASTTDNPAVKITGGGSLVDSFDSRIGCVSPPCSYATQPHLSNGDVVANGGIDIKGTFKGDVVNYVNVNNTDVVIESGTTVSGSVTYSGAGSYSNSGTVTGGFTQQASSPVVPQTVNNCSPYPASMDSFVVQYDGSGNVVAKSKWSYNSATGALTISTGSVSTGWVSIQPGNYCLGSLVASGGSLIKISDPTNLGSTPEAATIITVNGQVNLSGGSFANLTNDAQNLQLISTYGNDAGETSTNNFVLSGGSGAYMVAYAPYTRVTISGSGDIYGAVVGNTIVASGGSKVHYDECLGRADCATKLAVGVGSNPVITYTLAQWRQSTCTQSTPASPWSCS